MIATSGLLRPALFLAPIRPSDALDHFFLAHLHFFLHKGQDDSIAEIESFFLIFSICRVK